MPLVLAAAFVAPVQTLAYEQLESTVVGYMASRDGDRRFSNVKVRLGRTVGAPMRPVTLAEVRARIAKCGPRARGGGDDVGVAGGYYFALDWRCPGVAPEHRVLTAIFKFRGGKLMEASFYEDEVPTMPAIMPAHVDQ
jgi:hypothetical protein